MKIKELLPLDDALFFGNENTEIKGLAYNSNLVKKDYAFFALPGHNTDGKKYIPEAIEKGAALIITSQKLDSPVNQIVADDVFGLMSTISAKFYDFCDRKLKIIAVTGTNGKTSITYMIESILSYAGIDCGVFGTINYRYKNIIVPAPNTTPQSLDLYSMMNDMVKAGVKYLVMETSSHALALGRTAGLKFDVGVFTNLTLDHLDFHGDIESYFLAKSKLFTGLKKGAYSIINIDDDYGKRLKGINTDLNVLTYSVKDPTADIYAKNIAVSKSNTFFEIKYLTHNANIEIKHVGLHNIYNALASVGAVCACGVDFNTVVEGLRRAAPAPGRLEKVGTKNLGFEIVVDYAHTDDALKNVLEALRHLKPKRIITVFGCGGDRDRSKRPKMGELAVNLSDFVFVTSDNPRTENPDKILLDIEVGIKRINKTNYKIISDRACAINEAVAMASKGDVILLAGKGHENYQIIGHDKIHFDDKEAAQKCVAARINSSKKKRKPVQGEFNF